MSREYGRPSADQLTGQLPDWAIAEFLQKGIIKIDPLPKDWEGKVDSTTYDFHLGSTLHILKTSNTPIDPRLGVKEDDYEIVDISNTPYIIESHGFVIAKTLETLILPDDIQARLDGKSSLARIALGVHITSARFDPGWNRHPVLELINQGPRPIILIAGMSICAFAFDKLAWPVDNPYDGRYKNGTVHSLVHQENNLDL